MKETNNPRSKRASSDDTAEIGIGTMIVFIAAVIVAAIAAAVLVNTAGNLQRTAQETGDETTQEVSGNIFVRDITGHVTSETNKDKINSTNFTVALAPGADSIDLETMTIQWKDNETLEDLSFQGHAANSGTHQDCESFSDGFCVLNVVEEEGTGDNVLEPGDLVHLHVGMDESGEAEPLETRMDVDVKLMPENGAPVVTGFSTPSSYDGQSYVALK